MAVNLREVELFRPYSNEFPENLLWDAGADETCVARWQSAEIVRIARYQDELAAVYAMDRPEPTQFILHGLVVAQPLRKQGLGRWVVGHAIGVAESKGGRHIQLPASGGTRCFSRIGFVTDGSGWRFDLIPE